MVSALALGTLAVAACGDDPTGPEEEHADPRGFAIEVDGVEVERYLDALGGLPTIELLNGTTYEVAFVLLDLDGDPLPHEEHEEGEEEEGLRVDIQNGSLLTWVAEDHEGGEEEHAFLEFHGELTTLDTGNTTLALCLEHGDHCDYESPTITVTIN